MKHLSLVKDEDINNFYKIVSENVKRIRNFNLDSGLEIWLKINNIYSI